jgi:hypothetical protein
MQVLAYDHTGNHRILLTVEPGDFIGSGTDTAAITNAE